MARANKQITLARGPVTRFMLAFVTGPAICLAVSYGAAAAAILVDPLAWTASAYRWSFVEGLWLGYGWLIVVPATFAWYFAMHGLRQEVRREKDSPIGPDDSCP